MGFIYHLIVTEAVVSKLINKDLDELLIWIQDPDTKAWSTEKKKITDEMYLDFSDFFKRLPLPDAISFLVVTPFTIDYMCYTNKVRMSLEEYSRECQASLMCDGFWAEHIATEHDKQIKISDLKALPDASVAECKTAAELVELVLRYL